MAYPKEKKGPWSPASMQGPLVTTDHCTPVYHDAIATETGRPYSRADLDEIRASLPDYLRHVHGIENFARHFRCVYPDHSDNKPSMVYNANHFTVHCFGCGAHGDIFDVAGWDAGVGDFRQKIAVACEGAGIRPSHNIQRSHRGRTANPRTVEKTKLLDHDIRDAIVTASFRLLCDPGAASARSVLESRGFQVEDAVRRDGIGWCRHPSEVMPGRFVRTKPCADGFLAIPFPDDDEWTGVHYAVFRPVGLESGPKELKPSGCPCPVFREHLLSLAQPQNARVYIVEAPFDAMALERMIPGARACALCGGGITRLLSVLSQAPANKLPRIVLGFDRDEAGKRFAKKAGEELLRLGIPHGMLPPFPNGEKDANEALLSLVKAEEAEHGHAA